MSYGPPPKCVHGNAIAETFANCDSCRLAEAVDLLAEWEASVTIESPPALSYRTSKFLHPEAYRINAGPLNPKKGDP